MKKAEARAVEERRPRLARLAREYRIVPSYRDMLGRVRRTSDATMEALLAGMGVDASTEALARRALERQREEAAGRLLPPVRVAPVSAAGTIALPRTAGTASWRLVVTQEDGVCHAVEGAGELTSPAMPIGAAVRGRARGQILNGAGELTSPATPIGAAVRGRARGQIQTGAGGAGTGGSRLRLPFALPPGHHRLTLSLRERSGPWREAEQQLIVAPESCTLLAEVSGRRRVYGILANLYTVRSARNWGIGNLTDLRALVDYAADAGADFVGINPLHALGNRGREISPYSPLSRLYRNPLYLDLAVIPELAATPAVRRRLGDVALHDEILRLRQAARVDYERIEGLELPLLIELHRTFAALHRERDTPRGRAYRRYLAEQGEPLTDFATFMALRSHWRERGAAGVRSWPAPHRDARSAAVEAFRQTHGEEVDFHRYLQFEVDRQLAAVSRHARSRGLSIGIYQDLALGSSREGSDAWGFPGLFVRGVNLGAPPDDYAAEGQDWGLPPLDPRRLAADGYRYWTLLLRASLAHGGALRIDHVMGLFRQFWIPAGRPGSEGAYVRFPFDDLVGILALESRRAGALVIGEDLGTVPRELPAALWRRGILSNRVLYFGRDRRGTFWPASSYPEKALVSANTHDMIPLAGFWEGTDLEIKRRAGLISSNAALRRARAARERERRALVRRLKAEGLLAAHVVPDGVEVRRAVHAFLCRTRSALAGISLDDLCGENTPVNQPGVPLALYPSWSRRMKLSIEALAGDPEAKRVLGGARGRRRPTVGGRHAAGK